MSLEENEAATGSTDSTSPVENSKTVQETATPQNQPTETTSEPAAQPTQPEPQQPKPDVAETPAPVISAPAAETVDEKTTDEKTIVEQQSADVVGKTPPAATRVKLNPVGSESAKAIPTLASTRTEAEQQAANENKPGSASAEQVPQAEPVEIPASEQLGTDLEAELDAALKGAQPATAASEDLPTEAAPAMATPKDDEELEPGMQLKGKVDAIEEENLIIDIGFRSSGILNKRDLEEGKSPELGSTIDVIVVSVEKAEGLVHLGTSKTVHRAGGDWNAISVGQVVECTVEKTNKGGLSVVVSQLKGFMPAGQVDLNFVGDLEPFVGQKLTAKVIDVNPKKRNLVVSRRAILQEERDQNAATVWENLAVGEQRTGTVKTIKDYGAFVDIGGVDGLLHVRELSWTRIKHPSDILKQGQEVEVKILTIDNEKKKISLGMKQLQANPWDYAESKYPKKSIVKGIVKKTTEFGAFLEIEEGLEGLIHISELDFRRVNKVTDVVKEGQEVEVQVIDINKNKQRISLSVKAIKPKPQASPEQVAQRAADAADEKVRREAAEKRRLTLKGGNSNDKGGGLFGNPTDFK